jgi:hypothetical protein
MRTLHTIARFVRFQLLLVIINSADPPQEAKFRTTHYAIVILAWPLIRLARRPYGSSPLRALIYGGLELLLLAILSGFLMLGVGLFTASTINQVLVVLGAYAFVLAGKFGGEW